jgi:hypothetical protein
MLPIARLDTPVAVQAQGRFMTLEDVVADPSPDAKVEELATINGFLREDILQALDWAELTTPERIALFGRTGMIDDRLYSNAEIVQLIARYDANFHLRAKDGRRLPVTDPNLATHVFRSAVGKVRQTPAALRLLSVYSD